MKISPKESEIMTIALGLYMTKIKKMLKDSEALKAGDKDIKRSYLDASALLEKLSTDSND